MFQPHWIIDKLYTDIIRRDIHQDYQFIHDFSKDRCRDNGSPDTNWFFQPDIHQKFRIIYGSPSNKRSIIGIVTVRHFFI